MYYNYSVAQWLFFFYFYCFFGWCFESTYVSLHEKHFVNRGFMRGPFLPLYGSGAIMMLLVSAPFQSSIPLTYVAGCVGATALEYVTGVSMEALFKVRYWDYSQKKFNYKGHICLSSTLAWGLLTILMTGYMHKAVEKVIFMIPSNILTIVTFILTAGIFADFALAFKAAMDLRDILIQMEKAKVELAHIQKRLDVIIAVANDEINNKRDELVENAKERIAKAEQLGDKITDTISDKVDDIADSIYGKVDNIGDSIEDKVEDIKANIDGAFDKLKGLASTPSKALENAREELAELKAKYALNLAHREQLTAFKDKIQRAMIRSNPTMSSIKYKEALEELKNKLSR